MNRQHSPENGRTVQSKTGVLLVGGGNPALSDIVDFMAVAPRVVAADGGANFCVSAGVTPACVIGDLDSLTEATQAALPETVVTEYADQNLTDFEKCLRLIEAPFVIGVGFTGGRLDHTLAVFAVLARRIGPPTVLLGSDDIAFAMPETLRLTLPVGTRLSLFPMVPMQGKSQGLTWPIDGLTIAPLGRLGTSNEVSGPVEISFDRPGANVVIPRAHLTAALAALTG